MRRGGLLWRTYRPLLLVSIAALALVGVLVSRDYQHVYLDQVARDLVVRGQLYDELTAAREPNRVQALTQASGRATGTRYTLIATDGTVLADSDHDPASMENHRERPEVAAALAGRVGRALRDSVTLRQTMMYVAIPAPTRPGQMVVRAALPVRGIWQTISLVVSHFLWGAMAIAVLGGLATLLSLRGIRDVLDNLRAGANRFASGQLTERLAMPPVAELADLTAALNAMAAQLAERLASVVRGRNELEAVLESMAEGVVTLDNTAHITGINPAAAELFETQAEQAVGRLLLEVVRHRDVQRFAERALGTDSPIEGEIVWFAGEERYLQAHASRLRDHDGRQLGALLVLHDMTRLRRLEAVRREFVANVSHELRTPVASIKGSAETLLSGALDEPEAAQRFAEMIARHADRLGRIIEDLLSLSRLDQMGCTASMDLVDGELADVARAAAGVVADKAAEKGVSIAIDCADHLATRVNAPLLEQAVANLLDNAVTYSEPGQTVAVTIESDDAEIRLSVADAGCGIAAEHLPRLFERFYRVDKARSRKLGGTGLGLSIAKHIVGAHGGTITVESRVGQGSTFTIHLPRQEVRAVP
ncbi:MAG: PAS domain-containing protein [Armatimonadetes bacterium]|nr:PAS domain-containing protein [Armatimonadota bacterium]